MYPTSSKAHFDKLKSSSIQKFSATIKRSVKSRTVRSIWKLSATTRGYKFFNESEAVHEKDYCDYSRGGLVSTPTGLLSNVFAEITKPDFVPADLSGGTTAYNIGNEIKRLLSATKLKVIQNTFPIRELQLSQIHIPVPNFVTTSGAIVQPGEWSPTLISVPVKADSNIIIEASIPPNAPAIHTDLDGYYVTLYVELFEHAQA